MSRIIIISIISGITAYWWRWTKSTAPEMLGPPSICKYLYCWHIAHKSITYWSRDNFKDVSVLYSAVTVWCNTARLDPHKKVCCPTLVLRMVGNSCCCPPNRDQFALTPLHIVLNLLWHLLSSGREKPESVFVRICYKYWRWLIIVIIVDWLKAVKYLSIHSYNVVTNVQ